MTVTPAEETSPPSITKAQAQKLSREVKSAWTRARYALQQLAEKLSEMEATRAYMLLGYRSLAEYIHAELPPNEYRLSVADRRHMAVLFRQLGLSLRDVGETLSVSAATIKSDLAAEGADGVTASVSDRRGQVHAPTKPTASILAPVAVRDLLPAEVEALEAQLADVALDLHIGSQQVSVVGPHEEVHVSKRRTSEVARWWAEVRMNFAESQVVAGGTVPEWYRQWVQAKLDAIKAADGKSRRA